MNSESKSMLGITLRARHVVSPFWDVVDEVSHLELKSSVRSLGYAPHVTLARYPSASLNAVASGLEAFRLEPPFMLAFERIRFFDADPLTLWLEPVFDARLIEVQHRLHTMVALELSDTLYRPELWVPHLTVALAIPRSQKEIALERASRRFTPFTLRFDCVDVISWPPIEILASTLLDDI